MLLEAKQIHLNRRGSRQYSQDYLMQSIVWSELLRPTTCSMDRNLAASKTFLGNGSSSILFRPVDPCAMWPGTNPYRVRTRLQPCLRRFHKAQCSLLLFKSMDCRSNEPDQLLEIDRVTFSDPGILSSLWALLLLSQSWVTPGSSSLMCTFFWLRAIGEYLYFSAEHRTLSLLVSLVKGYQASWLNYEIADLHWC